VTALTITAALSIDCGVNDRGYRTRPPRARYECLRCHTTEEAIGATGIAAFVGHIRTTHRATCPAANYRKEAA
jgi:hypothetical protein